MLYFWRSVALGEGTDGGFSWWGEICPLAVHRCSSTMPWQHLPQRLLVKWPNPHRGLVNPRVLPALDLLQFSGCPRRGISAALIVHVQSLCAGGVWSPVRMGLKEERLLAMLCLLQGLPTIWQHPGFQAGTFNDVPATPQMRITDHGGLSQQSLE